MDYNNKNSLLNLKSLESNSPLTDPTLTNSKSKNIFTKTKDTIENTFDGIGTFTADKVLKLFSEDYREYAKAEQQDKIDNYKTRTAQAIRERLKLDDNPATEETLNNLEQIKNNPLFQYINIDKNTLDNDIQYLKADKNNSSQNLIKNGTKNTIIKYKDKDYKEQQLYLNGDELITEDTDNIYINDVIIPKHIKRPMTDDEFIDNINNTQSNNYSLNKTMTKRMATLMNNIPDDIRKEIDYLDPIGIDEFMYLNGLKAQQEPLVESALNKVNQKQYDKITDQEYEALLNRKYIDYSYSRRGIHCRAKVFAGVIDNIENTLIGTGSMLISNLAIDLALTALAPFTGGATGALVATRVGAKVLKVANKFNQARKTYKTLQYSTNALKWAGITMTGAGLDTLVRTHIFENILPIDNKQDRIREKRNNWMLQLTDKGNLIIREPTEEYEKFFNYQDNIEQFNEAWSERAVDPIVNAISKGLRIPTAFSNNTIMKILKKANKLSYIPYTQFSGIATEHLEEYWGIIANHIMKANDPDTSLYQAIAEYSKPENFAVSTLNIMIAGGLVKGVSNIITGNPNGKETESIDRKVLKNFYKKKFEENPDLIINTTGNKYNSITKDNYERIIDNLKETNVSKIAEKIIKTENKQAEERYQTLKDNLKNDLISSGKTEIEANNLIKLFEGNYENLARAFNVSKSDMAEKLRLMVENKNEEIEHNNNKQENNTIEDINTFYQKRPEIEKNIDEVIGIAKNTKTENKKIEIGKVSDTLVKQLKQNGLDITDYTHNIDTREIRHILKGHGKNGTKLAKNSIAITNEDIKQIPYIIENYDYIMLGKKSNNGNDSIRYIKTFNDGTIYFVEEVRNKNKTLSAKTMWKEKISQDKLLKLQTFSSANAQGSANSLKKIIPNPNLNVKENEIMWIKKNGTAGNNARNRSSSIIYNPNKNVKENNNTFDQTAFHGSPYNFDKFSLDHMGEGEGAQAHGYGLYFALDRRTAEGYKNNDNISVLSFIPKTAREIIRNIEEYPDYTYYYDIFTDNNPYSKIKEEQKNNKEYLNKGYITAEQYKAIDKVLKEFLKKKVYNEPIENKGKLYEVDIPEDYEMLREETPFKKQSKEVKKAIRKLLNDNNKALTEETKNNIIRNLEKDNYIGRSFYDDVATNFRWNEKQAVELLNQYGIKGIRYYGEKDGECAVVFDDEAISIMERYNQNKRATTTQSYDWLNNGVAHSIINSKNLNVKKNSLIKTTVKNILQNKSKYIDNTILLNGNPVDFNSIGDIKHFVGGNSYNNRTKIGLAVRQTILDNLKTMLKNASLEHTAKDNGKHKRVNDWNYYEVKNINMGGQLYNIVFDTYTTQNSNINYLYDFKVFKKNSTTTLTQEINNDTKGQITFLKNKAIITLFNGKADQSTILHELAHYYLELIRRFADDGNAMAKNMLEDIKEWTASEAEVDPTYFLHERFARSYEYYIRTGKFQNKNHQSFMKEIFEYFKKFLESIYKTLSDLQLDNVIDKNKMEKFFDEYLFNPETPLTPLTKGGSPKDRGFIQETEEDLNTLQNDGRLPRRSAPRNDEKTEKTNLTSLILNQTIIGEFNEDLDNRINEYVEELKAEGDYDPRDIEEIVKWKFEDDITMATEEDINRWNTKLDTEANNIKFAKNVIKIAKDVAQEVISTPLPPLRRGAVNEVDRGFLPLTNNTKITRKEQGEAIYKPLKEKQSIEQQTEFQKRFNVRFNEELETQLLNNNNEDNNNPLYLTSKETDKTIAPAEHKYLTTGEREILNNIKNAIGKIYAKQWKEQTDYNNKVLKDVNDRRSEVSRVAEEEGYESMKLKPYRNIEEALADSEYSKMDYRERAKANYRNGEIQDYGFSGNDYGLTLEEYQNIIDFRKKFITNRVNSIVDNLETALRTIEKNKDEILRRKRFETLAIERMEEAKKQLKENNNLIDSLNNDLKLDIKQYREVLDNIGFFNELETKRKIINYSQNHNPNEIKQYIENERLKLVKKKLKEDIRNVLDGVIHISKRTGQIYNNTLYEDTGLFNDLIKISEYSTKKAREELVRMTDSKNTINNPIDLTKEFNFIKSTDKEQIAQEIENYLNDLIEKGAIDSKTEPLQIEITKENKYHIKNSNVKLMKGKKTRHNLTLLNLETIINNAIKIGETGVDLSHNIRTKTIKHKQKVNKYIYFNSQIKINDNIYGVELATEEIKGQNKNILDIYNIKMSLIQELNLNNERQSNNTTNNSKSQDPSSEPLSHTKLKQRLLYFMANDIIDTKEATDLLTTLGRLVKESQTKLQQLQDENKGEIAKISKDLETAIRNNKLTKGRLNLNTLQQGYMGNLPTLLTYIANKKTTKEFDFADKEKTFDVNYQAKINDVLKSMEQMAGGETKAKELYKSWNETLMDDETNKPLKLKLTTKDNQGDIIHRTFELKDSIDNLTRKLADNLLEQTDKDSYVESSIAFLERLKNITPEKGGFFKYKYELTRYEYDKLLNIIDNTTQEFKTDAKNIKIINDLNKANVIKFEPVAPYEINTWNLMYYYLQSKNKQTRKLIETYYSHYYEKLDNMVKQQSKEFFDVAELLFKAVQDINELNPYHMLVKNRPMGRVDNYFPRVSIHQDELSIFDMFNNETPREQQITALNSRTFNAIPNLSANPLALTSRHIMQTEYLKNIAVPLKNTIMIFKKQSIQQAIEETKGVDIKNALMEHLDELKYGYNQSGIDLDNMFNYFIGNWAKAKTNTISVFLKQFTSFIPYMENLNKSKYMKNFLLKGLAHPVDTYRWMMEHSPYARTRIEDKPFDYILEEIKNDKNREQPIIDFFKNFNDILRKYSGLSRIKTTLPKLGDTLSVVYGGYARIQTLIQNGMAEEQAIKDFESQTIETQQSEYSSLTPRSRLKHRTNNRASKLAKMFTSQDAQYYQKTLQYFNNYFNGDIKKAEFYSHIALYHLVLPLAMTIVNNLIIASIFGKKEKQWWDYIKDFLGFSVLSFMPVGLLGQAVALDTLKAVENIFTKPFYKSSLDLAEVLTGLPVGSYWRLLFNRYYKSPFDLYDTEETKKKKENKD